MTDDQLWNDDEPIGDRFGVDVPDWIDKDITPSTVMAICQGGCASGAYMPAVTYHTALETMNQCGDDVWEYIDERLGEVPYPTRDYQSWSGAACFYLSYAVELWAREAYSFMKSAETDDDA